MPTEPMDQRVKIESWKDLAEILGVMRGGMSEESTPSVELKNLSGGIVQKTVKVYNKDPYQAKDDCVTIYNELTQMYG